MQCIGICRLRNCSNLVIKCSAISPVKKLLLFVPILILAIDWALALALLPGVTRQVVEAELGAWQLACVRLASQLQEEGHA